jgi:RNA polymerase sigma factor (sigma-70 family)
MSIDRLFLTWYPRLVGAIYRRLGSRDEAEDVAQDAFVRLLDQRPKDPSAWLFTVAGRLATDNQRTTARRQRLTPASDDVVAPPDEALLQDEVIESVRRVLHTLPDRDRQILLLHHDGVRYREIASRLGVAESSVGSLLTRAHRRFLSDYQRQLCITATEHSAPFSTASSTRR